MEEFPSPTEITKDANMTIVMFNWQCKKSAQLVLVEYAMHDY